MGKKLEEKKDNQKPTKESNKSLKKQKTEISPLDKNDEKKPPFKELLPPPEEKESSASPGGEEEEPGKLEAPELEEICGNLWVLLYQLGGVLKKGFEPITNDVKKLLSPPTARMAVKYEVQDYMKDEFFILGVLGIDISKRLMVKKKKNDDSDSGKKEKR
ncbi:hypothetical protein ES702_07703 [subsurface metagenome]